MTDLRDRLYDLLPAIYRIRDVGQNDALRDLLRVIAEQVDVVESDIAGLYENWFIETCDDWAVPYIGDLVGYRQVHEAGELAQADPPAARRRNRFVIPRRDVANTLRSRSRRGTLAVLEQLAMDVAGWPARAVEFAAQLGRAQSMASPQFDRGRTADLRDVVALGLAGGSFDTMAHTVDVRSVATPRDPGRFNIPNIGLFVWRLRAYPITQGGALRIDQKQNHYTFSLLGNDMPLYTRPRAEAGPTEIAGELNVPVPITRFAFERDKTAYYGGGKSLAIYRAPGQRPIPTDAIIVADLSDWQRYRPLPSKVAVDPELGRIIFPAREDPEDLKNVVVSYHYGFSADIGGGEYERRLSQNTMGYALVRSDHLRDSPRLLLRLRDEWGPLANELRARMDDELRQYLEDYTGSVAPDAGLLRRLIEYLNRVLQGKSLYSLEHFPDLADDAQRPDAGTDTREAWRLVREDPRGPRLVRLNRLLLERHFGDELALSYRYYPVVFRPEESDQPSPRPITDVLRQWSRDAPRHAVVEILDSGDYTDQLRIRLAAGQTLELRAGERCRPAIRMENVRRGGTDDLIVNAAPGSQITFDGLLIMGRGLRCVGDPAAVVIRHCTLVPGWEIDEHCQPKQGQQPSVTMIDSRPAGEQRGQAGAYAPGYARPRTHLTIEHAIVGSIFVQRDAVGKEPLDIAISDSMLDATGVEADALCDTDGGTAHAILSIARSTVIGEICTHAIGLAENSIFYGKLRVARTQRGCMRFCSVTPNSRTPRRFSCQPDLAEQAAERALRERPGALAGAALQQAIADEQERERLRVRPQFTSTRYGSPTYCRLDATCATEIASGADDESEMGVFHDLFQPQRAANLRARLDEYAVAGMEAAVIFVD